MASASAWMLALAAARQATGLEEATAAGLQRLVFQPEVFALENCSCVRRHGGAALSRFYHLDYRNAARSGLNHQISNLRAILAEGLGLGRAVLLGPPSLTRNHNFDRPFLFNRWGDFISFERSSFRIEERHKTVCEGTLASCVADVSDAQLAQLVEAKHESLGYHDGPVSDTQNAVPGLLRRRPAPPVDRVPDRLNLFRRLPNMTRFIGHHRLVASFVASDKVLGAVPSVVDRLRALSKTGVAAVVHCRRGDKITNSKYCPAQMDKATSPARIAEVLDQSGIKPGSAIYIMSNELNLAHFDPLRDVYGYHFLTQAVFCVENIQ